MRLLKSMLIAAVAIGLSASAASAVVTISHVDQSGGTVDQGGTFDIDVVVDYDGTPSLTGIFASAIWDDSEVSLVGFTSPSPFVIFPGATGILSKTSDPANFPGDPTNTIRTVQHGAGPGQSAGPGPSTLITTLTFQVIGGTDGTANIDVFFNSGDIVTDGNRDAILPGAGLVINNAAVSYVPIPEPGTALLMGLGLAGLGLAGRRK